MKLFPYQSKLADDVIESLQTHNRVVACCPTGSGKTITAISGIIPRLPSPTLWVTHRRELVSQVKALCSKIDVRMIQSFKPDGSQDFASVIVDEGHHVCASQYTSLFGRFPNSKFIALTATPYRLDGVGLGSCGFSEIVYGPDTLELTESGFLCPALTLVPVSESTSAWSVSAMVQEVKNHDFSRAIVYCRSVSDCRDAELEFRKLGISANSIDGQTPTQKRDALHLKFGSGKVRVLVNHSVLTEGYDAPDVDLVVLNRATESRCLWKQMVGRGLRTRPGKNICKILDLATNAAIHGGIYDLEICDLRGEVQRTQPREQASEVESVRDYKYGTGEELKPWIHPKLPRRLHENLRRRSPQSLWLKLRTECTV